MSKIRQYLPYALLVIAVIIIGLQLVGCQSNNFDPYLRDAAGDLVLDVEGQPILLPAQRALLDRIEFDDDESGCVNIIGQIDLNPAIFFSSNAQIILKKVKVVDGDTDPPEC